jgi:DNA-directed RNA polymerase subunit beta'
MQAELAENDLSSPLDSASEMVLSGGMGGKKTQLMKLRTSPGVITDAKGQIIPHIVKNSYSEGLSVRDNWLQAIQGRKAYQDVQLSTASPGELSKVMSNLLNSSVVSQDDCGTKAGIPRRPAFF